MAIDSIGSILENRIKFAKHFDDAKSSDMSIETFYQLLIAEMSNQDPLDPMSNTEFISQMASFTALQVQQEALYYNNSNYATSMAGKTVIVASGTGTGLDVVQGVVEKVNLTGGQFEVTVNGKEYPLKNIMEVLDGNYGAASGSDGAFATSLIGQYVTVSGQNGIGANIVESGIVERIEIKDSQFLVIIEDKAYPLNTVVKVEPKSKAPGGTVDDE